MGDKGNGLEVDFVYPHLHKFMSWTKIQILCPKLCKHGEWDARISKFNDHILPLLQYLRKYYLKGASCFKEEKMLIT